jgi:hypothetical protein
VISRKGVRPPTLGSVLLECFSDALFKTIGKSKSRVHRERGILAKSSGYHSLKEAIPIRPAGESMTMPGQEGIAASWHLPSGLRRTVGRSQLNSD